MSRINKIAVKVVYGYGSMDYVILDNLDDVARAYYAKIEKIPVSLAGRVISGQEIKSIVPDIHSYTGWYRSYEPTDADDFAQIERDVPAVLDELIGMTVKRVEQLVQQDQLELIGTEGLNPELLLNAKNNG